MDEYEKISCEEFYFTEESTGITYRIIPDEDLEPFGVDEAGA